MMGTKHIRDTDEDEDRIREGEVKGNEEEACHSMSYMGCLVGEKLHRRRYLVNFLAVMFGIAAPISVNSFVAELPLLVKSAPEGSSLFSKTSMTFMAGLMVPALYALSNRSSSQPKITHAFMWISGILIFGIIGTGILAFFHNVTTVINNVRMSTVQLSLLFVLALVAGSRGVLLMPYLRHFEGAHLNSFFIGENLSSFIPSVVALIQGIGGDPPCSTNTTNATESSSPYISQPNFSSRDFFLCILTIQTFCSCAFWFLEYLRVHPSRRKKDAKFWRERACREEHNSIKKLLERGSVEKIREIETTAAAELTLTKPTIAPGDSLGNCERIWLFVLNWLANFLSHGYLNIMEVYSSRPYGNSAYHLSVNLSQLAGTLACALAFWLPPLRTRGVTGIMGAVGIGTIYVTWLGLSSPMPIWRDTTHGVIILITSWILLISSLSYAKFAITAIIWQESNDASLYKLNFANLLGAISSCGLMFYVVNFTTLLTPYTPCKQQG